jgi:pimeloyl-ACP methyl ester carboxylesterase
MPTVASNGITITYETFGDPSAHPLLMISGLGSQLVNWDPDLLDRFVAQGHYVIVFDNRDQGASTWFDGAGPPDLGAIRSGDTDRAPYRLSDMAADAAGLLDALGVARAHILGVSMGGMIAQQFVIDHPGMTRTLTSIMSTPDITSVGQPTREAATALMVAPPTTVEEAQDAAVAMSKVIGSTGFPLDEERIRARAAVAFNRGLHPEGTARQMAAIGASPDRRGALADVSVPTLVVHGDIDPLVTLSGGEATAAAITGAILWVVPGMGHDLPREIWPELLERHAALVDAAR